MTKTACFAHINRSLAFS